MSMFCGFEYDNGTTCASTQHTLGEHRGAYLEKQRKDEEEKRLYQSQCIYDWIDARLKGTAKPPEHAFTQGELRDIVFFIDYALKKAKKEAEQKIKDRIAELDSKVEEYEEYLEEKNRSDAWVFESLIEQNKGAIAELRGLLKKGKKEANS